MCDSERRRPHPHCAGDRPLPRNSPVRTDHWRREKHISTEDMTTLLARSQCGPRLDPYSMLGTAMSAGQKSKPHEARSSGLGHRELRTRPRSPLGVRIHGSAPWDPPLSGASLIVQAMVTSEPLQTGREGVSVHARIHIPTPSFRYRCPLF